MHTILLVEDNVELADAIVRDLCGQGFQVVHVTGGEAALRESAAHSYDALVLDWMLPDLDGLAVLRRLQEALVFPLPDEWAYILWEYGLDAGYIQRLETGGDCRGGVRLDLTRDWQALVQSLLDQQLVTL